MKAILRVSCFGVFTWFAAHGADAATIPAGSCSSASVQSAIDSANSGDTVWLPGPCSSSWTSIVSIPGTKGITLDGQGATIAGQLLLSTNASIGSRITNFTLTRPGVLNSPTLRISGTLANAKFRVDHLSFTGGGDELIYVGQSAGLLDHCSFAGMHAADEFIHIGGYGAESTEGWSNVVIPGGADMLFIEDNTFTTSTSQSNPAWIQGYYGARVVYRYNVFNYVHVDAHGTRNSIGQRWWEAYNNSFQQAAGGNTGGGLLNMRAGSGIVFSNTRSGATGIVGLCEEDSGYPALYQIGRGQNQILYPAYAWNAGMTVEVDSCEAPEVVGMVKFNRDVYQDVGASCPAGGTCATGVGTGTTLPTACTTNTAFWKTDAGGDWDTTHGGANDGALYKCTSTNTWAQYYVPYRYPHPLQSGSAASPPATPTSLRIIP